MNSTSLHPEHWCLPPGLFFPLFFTSRTALLLFLFSIQEVSRPSGPLCATVYQLRVSFQTSASDLYTILPRGRQLGRVPLLLSPPICTLTAFSGNAPFSLRRPFPAVSLTPVLSLHLSIDTNWRVSNWPPSPPLRVVTRLLPWADGVFLCPFPCRDPLGFLPSSGGERRTPPIWVRITKIFRRLPASLLSPLLDHARTPPLSATSPGYTR